MPLTDFVRYLNAQHPVFFAGDAHAPAFVMRGGEVFAQYAGLRLGSFFDAVTPVGDDPDWGHAAGLSVRRIDDGAAVAEEALFALPQTRQEFVYLDRLVRALHALNYLTYQNWRQRGTLLLKVHPRHVASVASDHGLAFESILRSCGLLPAQIALVFDLPPDADAGHLVRAFANYRERGYLIAVNAGVESDAARQALLAQIAPELVILPTGAVTPAAVDAAHLIGARVLAAGDGAADSTAALARLGVDLVQSAMHAPGAASKRARKHAAGRADTRRLASVPLAA